MEKHHFQSILNDCHLAQFQKNVIKRFRQKFKNLDFGTKNAHFGHHKNFPLKTVSVTICGVL